MTVEELIAQTVRETVASAVKDAVAEALADLPTAQPDEPLLLTVQQAAESLAVSADTVYEEIRRGRLPKIQIGSAVRVSREDLGKYVAARRNAREEGTPTRG